MNKKNVKIIIAAAVILISVAILTLFITLGLKKKPIDSSSAFSSVTQTVTESTVTTATSVTPRYIIGAWNGKLAVFTAPDINTPSKVYDVYLTTLPVEEQNRIKAGILVYDEPTLQRLLEDYTS